MGPVVLLSQQLSPGRATNGGGGVSHPWREGSNLDSLGHCLPLDSLGAGSTSPAKPMWGLHSPFPGLCIPFPGCVSHRSYRGAGEKGEIPPELQW